MNHESCIIMLGCCILFACSSCPVATTTAVLVMPRLRARHRSTSKGEDPLLTRVILKLPGGVEGLRAAGSDPDRSHVSSMVHASLLSSGQAWEWTGKARSLERGTPSSPVGPMPSLGTRSQARKSPNHSHTGDDYANDKRYTTTATSTSIQTDTTRAPSTTHYTDDVHHDHASTSHLRANRRRRLHHTSTTRCTSPPRRPPRTFQPLNHRDHVGHPPQSIGDHRHTKRGKRASVNSATHHHRDRGLHPHQCIGDGGTPHDNCKHTHYYPVDTAFRQATPHLPHHDPHGSEPQANGTYSPRNTGHDHAGAHSPTTISLQ